MPSTIMKRYKKIKRIPLPLWFFIWLKKKIFILKTIMKYRTAPFSPFYKTLLPFHKLKKKLYSISMKLNVSGTMPIMKITKIQSNFQNVLLSMNPDLS